MVVVVVFFFLSFEDLGRMFDNSFLACTFFFLSFFNLKWRIGHAYKLHFFGQDQSSVAQRAE